jgi:hypothetical protein
MNSDLRRFTLRSKIKVNVKWLLYRMIHTIGKILRYDPHYGFT